MTEFTDLVLEQGKLALHQADGDPEGVVCVLATTLAFAVADGQQDIDEVLSRVRDDYETGWKVQAEMLHKPQH